MVVVYDDYVVDDGGDDDTLICCWRLLVVNDRLLAWMIDEKMLSPRENSLKALL